MRTVAALLLLTACARAAERDPRAATVVRLSAFECVVVENRVGAKDAPPIDSEEASAAIGTIGTACDIAAVAKTKPPYSMVRTPRHMPRDVLALLLEWLTPTKARPLDGQTDAVLRPIRFELREVLAGRDPYR